jgi:hypothetical protein
LKNFYKGGTSMDADFSRARNLKKDLEADLIWNGNFNGTVLSIDANFQGVGHFGALLTEEGIKQASSLIDEDYLGSFAISKKFIAENLHKKNTWDDDWLPCCAGGWATMKPLVQKDFGMSAQGIFDCSCYDLSENCSIPNDKIHNRLNSDGGGSLKMILRSCGIIAISISFVILFSILAGGCPEGQKYCSYGDF